MMVMIYCIRRKEDEGIIILFKRNDELITCVRWMEKSARNDENGDWIKDEGRWWAAAAATAMLHYFLYSVLLYLTTFYM